MAATPGRTRQIRAGLDGRCALPKRRGGACEPYTCVNAFPGRSICLGPTGRSEEHTSELQSHRDLHSFPTRRSSDLSGWALRLAEAPGRRLRALHVCQRLSGTIDMSRTDGRGNLRFAYFRLSPVGLAALVGTVHGMPGCRLEPLPASITW